jgi:hypothetical protein
MIKRTVAGLILSVFSTISGHAAVLTVGAGQTYTTLQSAVSAASSGDTIDVLAATYVDQVATIDKSLTIRGIDGTPDFTQSAPELPGLLGFLVISAPAGASITIDNLAFTGASISQDNGDNGAGIRYRSGNLLVENSIFTSNQDGILATPDVAGTGTVTIQGSMFSNNGVPSGDRAGYEHGVYATNVASLTVTDSIFQGTQVGNDIKSRAATTTVTGNYLDDGITGTTSYAVDASNGGVVTISGNTIAQGPDTSNWNMVAYASEGLIYADNALTVQDNLFTNTDPAGSVGVLNFASTVVADVSCNAFSGVNTPVSGPAVLSGNVTGTSVPSCAVPEPGAVGVLVVGMVGLLGLRRGRVGALPG